MQIAECEFAFSNWHFAFLGSQIVALPVLYPSLDCFRRDQPPGEDLTDQVWQLGVAREAKRDQLPGRQLVHAVLEVRRQNFVQPQPHLEPDDPILNRQDHGTGEKRERQQRRRHDERPTQALAVGIRYTCWIAITRLMVRTGKHEEVERWKQPGVVLQGLRSTAAWQGAPCRRFYGWTACSSTKR